MANATVKLPGKKNVKQNLIEAAEIYFQNVYGKADLTSAICIPPTPPIRFRGPTGQASGSVEEMVHLTDARKQGVASKVAGQNAEACIFHRIESLNEPCMCFAGVDIGEKKMACLKKFGLSGTIPSKSSIESDIIVLSPMKGLIQIEVKAGTEWKQLENHYLNRPSTKNCYDKLVREPRFYSELIASASAQLSTDTNWGHWTKVVSFPNCYMHELKPGYHKLGREEVQDFTNWWNALPEYPIDGQTYHNLRLVLIAVKTSLCAASIEDHRAAIVESIDKQKFLEDSDAAQFKQLEATGIKVLGKTEWNRQKLEAAYRRNPSVFSKDSGSYVHNEQLYMLQNPVKSTKAEGLEILQEQFVFLTPEQLEIWEGSNAQVVEGPPGSGKSLLLQYKAVELAKQGQKVLLISTDPMTKKYREVFLSSDLAVENFNVTYDSSLSVEAMKAKVDATNVSIMDSDTFTSFCRRDLGYEDCWDCLLFDDFFNSSMTLQDQQDEFTIKVIKKRLGPVLQNDAGCIWLMLDAQQSFSSKQRKGTEKHLLLYLIDMGMNHVVLKNVMRSSVEIAELYVDKWHPFGSREVNECLNEHASACIGHNERSKRVALHEISKLDFSDEFLKIFQKLHQQEGCQAHDVCVIEIGSATYGSAFVGSSDESEPPYVQYKGETTVKAWMKPVEDSLGWKFEYQPMSYMNEDRNKWMPNTVKWNLCTHAHSLEWPVVVVVVPNANMQISENYEQLYMAYSRAMYQLIILHEEGCFKCPLRESMYDEMLR